MSQSINCIGRKKKEKRGKKRVCVELTLSVTPLKNINYACEETLDAAEFALRPQRLASLKFSPFIGFGSNITQRAASEKLRMKMQFFCC